MPVILGVGKQRRDCPEFETSRGFKARPFEEKGEGKRVERKEETVGAVYLFQRPVRKSFLPFKTTTRPVR